ncbi:hypothetical protein AYI68_g8152 [Smittium mucronatum]|uniref:Uncharacterized protein n=1 Tax=Smittium mucronatum TaxID=133383 RepID=A0A1R0GLQ3_9FUNG|nr:hypothetical protein AYI68_g8152 [Smittium mucronatum]
MLTGVDPRFQTVVVRRYLRTGNDLSTCLSVHRLLFHVITTLSICNSTKEGPIGQRLTRRLGSELKNPQ